jgi:hypothetical protein
MLTRRTAVFGMFVAFFALVGMAPAALAADDATGTWKWSQPGRNNGPARESSLTLKQDGEKLTGSYTGPARGNNAATAVDISDGKVKDGEVSFKVVRKGQNGDITITYTGKQDGDTIKFKSEMAGGNNNAPAREFEAKRSK